VPAVGISSRVVAELDAVCAIRRAWNFWPTVVALAIELWCRNHPGIMILGLLTSNQRSHELLELSDPVMDSVRGSSFLRGWNAAGEGA
jgi:hypothetical protein